MEFKKEVRKTNFKKRISKYQPEKTNFEKPTSKNELRKQIKKNKK